MQPKLSFFVLAVALIALGVAAYAMTQVVPTPHVPGAAPAAPPADGLDDIERLLAVIEEARIREQWGSDPGILERLNDLVRRL